MRGDRVLRATSSSAANRATSARAWPRRRRAGRTRARIRPACPGGASVDRRDPGERFARPFSMPIPHRLRPHDLPEDEYCREIADAFQTTPDDEDPDWLPPLSQPLRANQLVT